MRKLLTILLALALTSICATAATIRVPGDQPTIQAGIDAAVNGDTVLLANGTYTGEGNRDIKLRGRMITLRSENGWENCIIDAQSSAEDSHRGFFINEDETRDTVIEGLTVTGGSTGIYVLSSPVIRNCYITGNDIGIYVMGCPLVEMTIVSWNSGLGVQIGSNGQFHSSKITDNGDSGIDCWSGVGGVSSFVNCLIARNSTTSSGGGVNCTGSDPSFRNCTIVDNAAEYFGGGLCSSFNAHPVLENCILSGNSAATGDQYALVLGWTYWTCLTISYSDVHGEIFVDYGCYEYVGNGMIEEDPRFIAGLWGGYYLSQTGAGQDIDSPCIDAGYPTSEMIFGTTRTDLAQDSGVVDMGYHYRDPEEAPLPDTLILSGPTGPERIGSPVVVYTFAGIDDEYPASALSYSWRFENDPWSDWSPRTWAAITELEETGDPVRFEVRARNPLGDFDPTPAVAYFYYDEGIYWGLVELLKKIVVGPGPGPYIPPLVRTSVGQWTAYSGMLYGVKLAAGDIDGDDVDEVITGPGPGPVFGPHVRCFRPDGTVVSNAGFLAYGTNKYGVNVAAGDIDGDGTDEIITGAGPGVVFGPHVRGWNWDGGPEVTPIPGINFFAYGTLKYGVNVACGDFDGDGTDEIITGAGPGAVFGPHVRGWRFHGGAISPMNDVSWFAFGTPKWGVNVACGDLDGDGIDEIITGAGPGSLFSAHVRAWDYDGSEVTQMPGINFFAYTAQLYGASVGAADVDGDGIEELLTLPGPGPENNSWLRTWNVDGGQAEPGNAGMVLDSWMTHGGSVAGSKNGWVPSVDE